MTPELVITISGAVATAAGTAFAAYKAVKSVMNGSNEKLDRIAGDQGEVKDSLRRMHTKQDDMGISLIQAQRDIIEIHKRDIKQEGMGVALVQAQRDIIEIHKYGCNRFSSKHPS